MGKIIEIEKYFYIKNKKIEKKLFINVLEYLGIVRFIRNYKYNITVNLFIVLTTASFAVYAFNCSIWHFWGNIPTVYSCNTYLFMQYIRKNRCRGIINDSLDLIYNSNNAKVLRFAHFLCLSQPSRSMYTRTPRRSSVSNVFSTHHYYVTVHMRFPLLVRTCQKMPRYTILTII